METGTDVAAGTIISAQHYRRIEEIRNSELPEAQKQAQIKQELASAAATGGLLLIGGVATGKGKKVGGGNSRKVADSPFAGQDFNSFTEQNLTKLRQNYKITSRDGKPPILSRKNRNSGHPPIHIEEVDGKYVIKNGHASGSQRLSNANTMRKNYEAIHGKLPDGHQIHHVIPDERVRNNPLAKEAYNRGIFDLDRASNLKGLPEEATPNKLIHKGSHPKWNAHVDKVLERKKPSY